MTRSCSIFPSHHMLRSLNDSFPSFVKFLIGIIYFCQILLIIVCCWYALWKGSVHLSVLHHYQPSSLVSGCIPRIYSSICLPSEPQVFSIAINAGWLLISITITIFRFSSASSMPSWWRLIWIYCCALLCLLGFLLWFVPFTSFLQLSSSKSPFDDLGFLCHMPEFPVTGPTSFKLVDWWLCSDALSSCFNFVGILCLVVRPSLNLPCLQTSLVFWRPKAALSILPWLSHTMLFVSYHRPCVLVFILVDLWPSSHRAGDDNDVVWFERWNKNLKVFTKSTGREMRNATFVRCKSVTKNFCNHICSTSLLSANVTQRQKP